VPEEDPVIQIANWVTVQGNDTPCVKNIFTLKSCAPISGAEVHAFESEREMLHAWRDFIVASDPDIVTGYNIVGFDIPYLVDRARTLKVDIFSHLGRIKGQRCRVKKTTFSSAQTGVRESNEITIEGRVIFDVFQAIQRDYKLHSYSLNSVCAKFLGEQKEDVHHSIISDLQNGDAESRRRLAKILKRQCPLIRTLTRRYALTCVCVCVCVCVRFENLGGLLLEGCLPAAALNGQADVSLQLYGNGSCDRGSAGNIYI
jgi:DNA polymerase delta subunit 1